MRIALNLEMTDRISLTISGAARNESIVFDGTEASWAALTQWQRGMVATLLFDTPEKFFVEQVNGVATRRLGSRFRATLDDAAGPFHDIYAVTHSGSLFSDVEGAKLFYFNSDTFLLDWIRYRLRSNGESVNVEVRLSNWQHQHGQKTARKVERLENGASVMALSIDSVVFNAVATETR